MTALIFSWLLALVPGAHQPSPMPQPAPPPSSAPARMTVLVTYSPGPKFQVGKPLSEQGLAEHFRYMVSLYTRGSLKQAGPFADESGGAVILDVSSEAEAREIVTKDPAVREGVFLYQLRPWTPVNWERHVPRNAASEPFRFTTNDFWLNLHQFLYVLGRDKNRAADRSRAAVKDAPADAARGLATVSLAEQETWLAAVAFYAAGPSRLDTVFDASLVSAGQALARAHDAKDLSAAGLEPGLSAALTSVADIYRRAFWPAHQTANETWVKELRPLLQKHGPAILTSITRAYATSWPANGYPARVTAYANWAGAFSTDGELLVLSSLDPALRGSQALEVVFHESMHQWDQQVLAALEAAGKQRGVAVKDWLSHAMIFFTAGEATRLAVPGHVPYADAAGVWARGREPLRQSLIAAWKPWLAGQGTREAALGDLVSHAAGSGRTP